MLWKKAIAGRIWEPKTVDQPMKGLEVTPLMGRGMRSLERVRLPPDILARMVLGRSAEPSCRVHKVVNANSCFFHPLHQKCAEAFDALLRI